MIKFGLDLKAPTTIKGDDGWRPVMVNSLARRLFSSAEDLFAFKDLLESTNRNLVTRVVEVQDDDPTYSL